MRSPAIHFLIALALGIATLVGYGAWYATVSAKSKEVADLQDKITTATETVKRIASARVALAEIAGDEAKVRGYFVSETSVVAFIDDLEARALAQKAPVNVLSVSKEGPATRPTLLLSLSIKGTFDAVMRTVGEIEYAPYDISIASLSVGQDAKDSWHADLSIIVGSVPATVSATTP